MKSPPNLGLPIVLEDQLATKLVKSAVVVQDTAAHPISARSQSAFAESVADLRAWVTLRPCH